MKNPVAHHMQRDLENQSTNNDFKGPATILAIVGSSENSQYVEQKRFALLSAQFALAGHALIKAKPDEGSAPYYAARWGWLRPVRSLDHAEQLLEQIRGAKS